jgi:O-antigen/teichoic acid export membrane protein
MAESSLKQKTAKGLFWGGLGNGVQQALGAVFGVVLARILTQEDYGLVGVLGIFSGIAITVVNAGFSVALTNKQDAGQKDYDAVFWFTVFAGGALYGALFLAAPLIAGYFGRPELIPLSRFLFLVFLLSGASTVSYTILFKKLMTKQLVIIDASCMLVALSLGIILAWKGFAYWALAVQMVVQHGATSILRFIVAPWRPGFRIDFRPLKPLLPFSFKLFLTNIFIQINYYLFSVIFGKLYSIATVGVYNQGQKWMTMGQQFVGGAIAYITQPVLVAVQDNEARQINVLRKLIRFGAFLSFPSMLGLAFVGKEFIVIALGEKWLSSVPFLQLSCIWGSVLFLHTLYTNLIYTHGKSNWFLYGTVGVGLLQILVIFITHPWGIYAMVMGYLAVHFIGLAVWQYCVSRLIRLSLADVLKDTLPYLAITLACFLIAWLLTRRIAHPHALISAKIGVSFLCYILIMKYSRSVIYQESLAFLIKRFKIKK